MKRLGISIFALVFFLTGSSVLWAGGADNKTNWSAEYIGILNRNAATDAADIVMYNPAGVMKMKNGLYGNLSGHLIAKEYNNQIDGIDRDQDEASVVPGLFTVYKQDKWAGFFGISNIVGGGKVDFETGNATTNFVKSGVRAAFPGVFDIVNQEYLKAEAMGLAYTIGGAYAINDMWSFSLGVRYLKSVRKMEGIISLASSIIPNTYIADVNFEEDADGFGGVIGINFSPSNDLNIGFHYDSQIDLDYKADVKNDTTSILPGLGVVNGAERSRNLPAVLAAGVSYKVTPKLRVETNLTVYLNSNADFPDIAGTSRDESAVDNGFDAGIGIDYALTDTLNLMCGYLYTDTGVDEAKDMTPELPELNAHTLGTGLKYKMTDSLNFLFSLGHVFYKDDSFVNTFGQTIKYEKDITFVGLGVEYKFL